MFALILLVSVSMSIVCCTAVAAPPRRPSKGAISNKSVGRGGGGAGITINKRR
jgi:hypothetical protein